MVYYISRICILYSLATCILSHSVTDCPCSNMDFCDCSSMNWKTIPSRLPKNMKGLNMSKNALKMVTGTDLKPYEKLKVLILQYNEIHIISNDSFQPLRSLEDLDLSYNNLTNLSSDWFKSLHTLKHLNLLGNQYSVLSKSLFSSLSSLRSLKVGNPYFIAIEMQHFEGLVSLNELYLHCLHLKQYAEGSFKTIKEIDHAILTVNISLLPVILKDLAFSVTWLEFRNASLMDPGDVVAFEVLNNTSVKKVMLNNCTITDASTARILEIIQTYQNVTDIILEDSELLGTGQGSPHLQDKPSSVTTAIITNLHIPNFFLFSDLQNIYKIAPQFKSITCTGSKVFLIPCSFSKSFTSLEFLDISGNLLTDVFLASSACKYEGGSAWPLLQTLNVSKNGLTSLPVVADLLYRQPYLTNLDISHNDFSQSSISNCTWPSKLKYLNISSCQIKRISTCIPTTVEILDLSSNYLTEFLTDLPNLKELYVSNNRLTNLPDDARLPNLETLIIRSNKLNDFFKSDLDLFPKLMTMDGSNNNYICSCQFLDFIQYNTITLLGWPDNYICDSPSSVRDKKIQEAKLPTLMCHKTLVVTLSCIILLLFIALIVALCYFLHVMWYVKMIWAWLKAKRKPMKTYDREICYDAFISYSERDSEWVENMMVQELETTSPPMKLCLHKRDFVPGKWIIDNIIDAMEKSYKTLFVLSEHFVQSEWCKYELEFSHFRLFDENNDTAILILLEPIEKETIPKRFCKLRKLMNTKTYLEWPTEEEQQEQFWFNLKSALRT